MDGQDSPYQVAAPCWLAELTLKVNLLKSDQDDAFVLYGTWKSIRRSCNRLRGFHRCHWPTRRLRPCIHSLPAVAAILRPTLTFPPFPLSPPSQEPDWPVGPALLPSPRHHLVPRKMRKCPPGKFCKSSTPPLSPYLRRGTGHDLPECQRFSRQASFEHMG